MTSHRTTVLDADAPALPNRRSFLVGALSLAAPASLSLSAAGSAAAADNGAPAMSPAEREVAELSKDKWRWMAERKVDSLAALFHEKAVFVHMGGSMSRAQELDVIKIGGIQYQEAQIHETSVRVIDSTAILLSRLRLVAVVGGNEVTNPFVVTEVYVKQAGAWKLASLSFTRTLGS